MTNYFGFENFDIESRMIEFGVKNEMTFNDLSDAEKADIFKENVISLEWTMEDALNLCNA